ncbi:MAG TPA: hypothetical protein VGY53_05225, partial [Isosphaeraceae bacterium]|nr:hypothetical protein [Isosphaeraceae bacterium]
EPARSNTEAEAKAQPTAPPTDAGVKKAAGSEAGEAPKAPAHTRPPVGFDPPGTAGGGAAAKAFQNPAGQAKPPEKVTAEDVWNDILREADRAKAERAKLDGMKPIWLEEDRREAERRQNDLVTQAINKAEADRPRFRADLQRVLARFGDRSAPEIDRLMDRYDMEPPKAIEEYARNLVKQMAGRTSRQQHVDLLRMAGLPETRVLDYLCQWEKRNLHARNGPRNEDEVLVRAARLLISVPVPPPRPAPPIQEKTPTATVGPLPPAPQPAAGANRRR